MRPLAFRQPEQLVRVVDTARGAGLHDIGMSVPELGDLASRANVFDAISAVWPVSANLTGLSQPERIEFLAVSPNYFSLLGAHAQMGRVFGPEDYTAGFSEAVVISDGLWRRLFGGDPNILGKTIRADNDAYVVVGVMPPDFRHPGRTVNGDVELWGTAGFTAAPFPVPPLRSTNMLPGAPTIR